MVLGFLDLVFRGRVFVRLDVEFFDVLKTLFCLVGVYRVRRVKIENGDHLEPGLRCYPGICNPSGLCSALGEGCGAAGS